MDSNCVYFEIKNQKLAEILKKNKVDLSVSGDVIYSNTAYCNYAIWLEICDEGYIEEDVKGYNIAEWMISFLYWMGNIFCGGFSTLSDENVQNAIEEIEQHSQEINYDSNDGFVIKLCWFSPDGGENAFEVNRFENGKLNTNKFYAWDYEERFPNDDRPFWQVMGEEGLDKIDRIFGCDNIKHNTSKKKNTSMVQNTIDDRFDQIEDIELEGKLFCFTGFEYSGRALIGKNEMVDAMIDLGGDVRSDISSKVDYLVIDNYFGRKYDKAKELQQKGVKIKIISRDVFEKIVHTKLSNNTKKPKGKESKAENKELMDSFEEVDKITEQMDSDLSKYGAYLEARKKSDEEAKVKKENAKAEALKKGKNDTDASKMYVVLLCEKLVGKLKRSAKDFYKIYEEDFPAYSKEELINLRKDVLALMDDQSACEVYSVQFKTLSLEEKFNFATRNLYNLYEGMRVFENYNKALEESKQWYTDDEILHAKKLIDEDLEETKNDLDSQLGAIEEKWLKYSTAKNCLQIFVTDKQSDKSDIRADAKDFQTVVGNSLVSVKLATNGAFVMSTIVMDCMPWYWGTTIEQIWQDAFNNEPVDERIINNDTNEIIDKAKVKILGKSSKSKATVKVDKQEPTNVKTTPKVIVSELDKKESKRLSETGENLLDNGQKQQAFSYFERALEYNPYNIKATWEKGLIFSDGDDIITKTVKIRKNCAEPLCKLLNVLNTPEELQELAFEIKNLIVYICGFSSAVEEEKSYYIDDGKQVLYENIIKNLGETLLYIGDAVYSENSTSDLKTDAMEAWKKGVTLCYNNLTEYQNGKANDYLTKIKQQEPDFVIENSYDAFGYKENQKASNGGCYIATCVYGSYDCPPVWTLRRYRDNKLAKSYFGKIFIKFYYATSPTLVKWFGNTRWFKLLWKKYLDKMVSALREDGYEDTPYQDQHN